MANFDTVSTNFQSSYKGIYRKVFCALPRTVRASAVTANPEVTPSHPKHKTVNKTI
jgi:hypothetical protein